MNLKNTLCSLLFLAGITALSVSAQNTFTSAMEYSADGITWTDCPNGEITGLGSGTYQGAMIYSVIATGDEAKVQLPAKGIYIVQSERKTVKVIN